MIYFNKSLSNKQKHGIDFEEAKLLWNDDRMVEILTPFLPHMQYLQKRKKDMIKLVAGTAMVLLMVTSADAGYIIKKKVGNIDTKLMIFGFTQIDVVGGKGMQIKNANSEAKADTNFAFRAQRIRLGWKYIAGKVRGKVFLDFNQKHNDPSPTNGASVPNMIKDAFIAYKFNNAFIPKLGVIKMPNGMGFTMGGWNLDIAERGFDKSLVLERGLGFMISGRGIGWSGNKVNGLEMGHDRPWKGFGYDVMVANQASRSKAVNSSKMGGNAYAVRGMFDYTEKLHFEASYGISENADGNASNFANSENYSNINIGIDSNLGRLSLKAEYTKAHNIIGIKDYDEDTYSATVEYFLRTNLELVTKTIQGSAKGKAGNIIHTTNLGNTYIGFNLFLEQPYTDFSRKSKKARNQQKIAFNYIVASGSGATEGVNKWTGLGGYRANAFIAQYQFKF